MLEAIKWCFILIGGVVTVFFFLGLLVTSFHSEPIPDKVEEALEEVARKRGRKK